ncbi:MAG: translocation/assembly module TamB domain-containing protein, partial [Polaromonas sp.]|nr:translocation/assembly module TamB domain-containing protein [Polaromonas sp.]
LAIRPNLTQRVGVQITGTALLPRVRLYAQPELPDAEKLSWLVVGRSSASGGAEAALLQQAALALLGSKGGGMSGGLAASLGLDELSYRGASSNNDGTTTEGAVTLGKRFSRNFYAAYERTVTGALGTLYVFYDLSQRFTVRAQAGQQSAVDLIFTVPYD